MKLHGFQTLISGQVKDNLSQAFNVKRTLDQILIKTQIIVRVICYFLRFESKTL